MTADEIKIKSEIEQEIAGRATLLEVPHKGRLVWAAVCARHQPGVHRYDVSGVACLDWADTLDGLHASLSPKVHDEHRR